MGKQGPCCHCGISITPLWRNGPADKPVLCNACGSRWRTKGSLVNYMPMHSGVLCGPSKKSTQNLSDHHSSKRKERSDDDFVYPRANYITGIMLEEETSTRSSTESRMSFSESCAQRALAASRASDCWPPWGSHTPSKRRSVMHRRPHPSNVLANVLPCFLLSSSPVACKTSLEDDLLVEYRPLSMTAEIGLGGMLIQPIVSTVTTQESQASSLLCDNKELHQSVAVSDVIREESLDVHVWDQSTKPRMKEKTKLSARSVGAIDKSSPKSWVPNKTLLENFPYNKHDVLQSCHSPLVFVELKDIINFDWYENLLSKQEQQQLARHVSPADTVADSLQCMFNSAQFESALRGFQALLSEGMFDSLASGISPGVLQHYRQLLTLSNLTTSGWMESCSQLLCRSRCNGSTKYVKIMQGKEFLAERLRDMNALGADVASSSIDLVATKNSTGSVTAERTIRKDYQQPEHAASRQKHSGKCNSVEKRRGNRPKSDAKNVQLLSKVKRNSAIQGMLIEAPFYGVLDHEVLLDLPSSLSFQQAEFLQKPAHSESCP